MRSGQLRRRIFGVNVCNTMYQLHLVAFFYERRLAFQRRYGEFKKQLESIAHQKVCISL
jgi:hypothetical protein